MYVKGTHAVSKKIDLELILLVKPLNSIGKHEAHGLRICQVELRFSSCICVYNQEKMCPVHLYHRVYLVDRNFLVQKYIFSCLPGTIRQNLVLQSK